jgi:hypothetical protein
MLVVLIRQGKLPQGYELQESDVGKALGNNFGRVLPIDVGRKIWAANWGLNMEGYEQAKARHAGKITKYALDDPEYRKGNQS